MINQTNFQTLDIYNSKYNNTLFEIIAEQFQYDIANNICEYIFDNNSHNVHKKSHIKNNQINYQTSNIVDSK